MKNNKSCQNTHEQIYAPIAMEKQSYFFRMTPNDGILIEINFQQSISLVTFKLAHLNDINSISDPIKKRILK